MMSEYIDKKVEEFLCSYELQIYLFNFVNKYFANKYF